MLRRILESTTFWLITLTTIFLLGLFLAFWILGLGLVFVFNLFKSIFELFFIFERISVKDLIDSQLLAGILIFSGLYIISKELKKGFASLENKNKRRDK